MAEDDIRVTVNLLNYVTGTHVVEPFVSVDAEGVEIRSTQPAIVTVFITSAITSTEEVTGTETLTETVGSAAIIIRVAGMNANRSETSAPLFIDLPRHFYLYSEYPALG